MKKIIIIVLNIILFTILSCTKDDSITDYFYPIIGTWKLIGITNQNGTSTPVSVINNCETLNTYLFNGVANISNGSGNVTKYVQNSSSVCVQSDTFTYDWESLGFNNYKFKKTENGVVNYENIVVKFTDNNTIMIFTSVIGPYTIVQTLKKQ